MTNVTQNRFDHQPDHPHNTLLYDSRREQFEAIIPFIREGLRTDDYCLYLVDDTTRDQLVDAFHRSAVDIESARESGQFAIEQASDLYLTDGRFDGNQVVDSLEEKISDAVDSGYDNLRITGEMTWAAEHGVDLDRLKVYERQVDDLFRTAPVKGICQYRRSRFPPAFISHLLHSHPKVVDGAEKRLNCHYEYPEEYCDNAYSAETVDRKLRTISAQTEVSNSLAERNRCLSLLDQLSDQLHAADRDEIEHVAGELIGEVISPARISVWQYESSAGRLQPQLVENSIEMDGDAFRDVVESRAWDTFAKNEAQEFDTETSPPVTGLLVPLGEDGVFCVETPRDAGFPPTDRHFVRTVVGQTEAVLERVSYERHLEKKNTTLQEQNSHLQRVNRINSVIRGISRALVDSTTEREIVQNVCDLLVEDTHIEYVWYGSYDPATEAITPTFAAGSGQGYLDALTLEDEWDTTEPSGRAVRTGDVNTVRNIYDEPPLAHWQEQALKRGFQSIISLPICFDTSLYGVFTCYSDKPDRFDSEMRAVLDELSDGIACAMNSVERKRALVSEQVTELEIQVTETNSPLVRFATENGCRIEIENVASTDKNEFQVFVTFTGVAPEEVRHYATTSPTISSFELLAEADSEHTHLFEITEQCVIDRLLAHNVVPQLISIEDGEAHMTVNISQSANVRNIIDVIQSTYPSAEIVRRRDRTKPLSQPADIKSELCNKLTDRQLEILQLALHSGYFERPRERTAEELADSLGVSHPTVSRHLREAERKVFSLLLGTESSSD
ncbi:MEDS domain-containing protein [Natrinema caseinilyticum]|uniref:MEDS domain-containing protein n=1 Tax=Natrinema caseinilyticum TaxID=2961570 RepID=UPI0020C41EE5|nr:MEDS domain-containing protein [Natrinema caseinilyticum]